MQFETITFYVNKLTVSQSTWKYRHKGTYLYLEWWEWVYKWDLEFCVGVSHEIYANKSAISDP